MLVHYCLLPARTRTAPFRDNARSFLSDERPGKDQAAVPCSTIPVVDLGKADGVGREEIIQQMLGLAKIRILPGLMDDTMNLFLELFDMPNEDKAELYFEDPHEKAGSTQATTNANEEVHLWRDILRHPCNPIEECIDLWPTKPARYRDIVGACIFSQSEEYVAANFGSNEKRAFSSTIYFRRGTRKRANSVSKSLSTMPRTKLNTRTSQTLNPITAVQQGNIPGLQVLKYNKVITNGKLKSAQHCAVNNSSKKTYNSCDLSFS